MTVRDWPFYRARLRGIVEAQLAETNFRVRIGDAARPSHALRMRTATSSAAYQLADLLTSGGSNALFITAEAGAGKTTLVLRQVLHEVESSRPPLLGQMGLWRGDSDILSFIGPPDDSTFRDSLEAGGHLVVFDAIDEAPETRIDECCELLWEFISGQFEANRFVLTARTGEVPKWFTNSFRIAEVLPLDPTEVSRHLAPGLERWPHLIPHDAVPRLLELCRNPLILAMALGVTQQDEDLLVGDLRSRSGLYQQFLRLLEERDAGKHTRGRRPGSLDELQAAVLRTIAWEMQQRAVVFADRLDIIEWLSAAIRDNPELRHSAGLSGIALGRELFELVAGRPPLKSVSSDLGLDRHGFIHATFRDVYVAQLLLRAAATDPSTFRLADALLDESRSLWPSIVHMAGLAPDPSEVALVVIDAAIEYERQELFVLAAQCLSDRWDVDRLVVDKLCILILDAFKNWGKPFDYELLRAAVGLLPLTSRMFPARLAADLRYCVEKYARFTPIVLENSRTTALLAMLESPNVETICNAAHTLLARFDQHDPISDTVVERLGLLTKHESEMVRREVLAVLQDLAKQDDRTAEALRDAFLACAARTDASPLERVYALNGVAACGEPVDYPILLAALSDPSNPYRDSASWALQEFLRRVGEENPALLREGLDAYVDCLHSESRDAAGCYAKGNIVYSIGALGGRHLRPIVEDFLNHEHNPFVIEDAVNCLGLLRMRESVDVVLRYLRHSDPAVKMKAAEALERIGDNKALPSLISASFDNTPVVREAADRAARSLRADKQPVLGIADLATADLAWHELERLLERASRRSAQSKRVDPLTEAEAALIKRAAKLLYDADATIAAPEIRGPAERREVILRNETFHRLRQLCHERAK